MFKKAFRRASCLLMFLPFYLFGAGGGNIASTIATNANTQIEESGKSVASVINTLSVTMGVLWIIVLLLTAFFNIEALKNHAKLLFGALVIIGIVYGLSAAAMN